MKDQLLEKQLVVNKSANLKSHRILTCNFKLLHQCMIEKQDLCPALQLCWCNDFCHTTKSLFLTCPLHTHPPSNSYLESQGTHRADWGLRRSRSSIVPAERCWCSIGYTPKFLCYNMNVSLICIKFDLQLWTLNLVNKIKGKFILLQI